MLSQDKQEDLAQSLVPYIRSLKKDLDRSNQFNTTADVRVMTRPTVSSLANGYDNNQGCITDDEDEDFDSYADDVDYEDDDAQYGDVLDTDGNPIAVYNPPKRNPNESADDFAKRKADFNKQPFKCPDVDGDLDAKLKALDDVLASIPFPKQKIVDNPKQDNVIYKRDSYVDGSGKTVQFKRVGMKVDWQFDASNSVEYNMNALSNYVTKAIADQFGGFGRITSIAVVDYQMIINGVCFMPAVVGGYQNFPLDVEDYIKNGCTAPFFKWEYLGRMRRLTTLSFDSQTFALQEVGDCLDRRNAVTDVTFFNVCKSLQVLTIGDFTETREDLNNPEKKNSKDRKKFKQELTNKRRWNGIFDGYTLDVYKGTSAVQSYTVRNFCEYATHRGDKGLLRFVGGTLVRGTLAVAGTAVNAGTHLIGGVVKGIKSIYKDATTPVSDSDAGL